MTRLSELRLSVKHDLTQAGHLKTLVGCLIWPWFGWASNSLTPWPIATQWARPELQNSRGFESHYLNRFYCSRRSVFVVVELPYHSTWGFTGLTILVPLIFNLCINDLPSVCKTCDVESYVDDSKLYLSFSRKETEGGVEDLRGDLLRFMSWSCSNRLLINPDKTKLHVFGSSKMLCQVSITPLRLWEGNYTS